MTTIDIKNAFGSAQKSHILNTFIKYNIPSRITNFVYSYLSNRKIIVSDNDYICNNVGIPQGSNIGPILWLLIINVLLECCKDTDYKIIAYADEITILLNDTATFYGIG